MKRLQLKSGKSDCAQWWNNEEVLRKYFLCLICSENIINHDKKKQLVLVESFIGISLIRRDTLITILLNNVQYLRPAICIYGVIIFSIKHTYDLIEMN